MNRTAQDEIAVYVEGVRRALAGLPAATRDELLEDLPEHLAEVLAEGGGSLTDRLGPPEAYASELSASAGLGAAAPPPTDVRSRAAAKAAEHRARLKQALDRADERIGPALGYAKASEFLVLLRPAWWVLRGYLAAMAAAVVLDDYGSTLGLLPRVGGDDFAAVLLLALGILGSIWLGRRGLPARRWPRRLLRLGSAFLVLFAVIGFFEIDSAAQRDTYNEVGYVGGWNEYSDIRDVFVYDDQGRLVPGARIYDQDGRVVTFSEDVCHDPITGSDVPNSSPVYPRCPSRAPFGPDGSPFDGRSSAPATATPTPEASRAPAPSTAPSAAAPAATASPGVRPSMPG